MSNHPFQSFIELISLDQDILKLHQQITVLQQETNQLLDEKKMSATRLEQFQKHVHDLRKMVDTQELDMRDLEEQEQKQKKRLDAVTNAKEHMAIKKEIDRYKRAQHDAESVLISTWNKLEIAQKELAEQQKHYDAKMEELHEQINKKQEEITQLQEQLNQKKSERPSKEVGLPQEWLDNYTHMRMQVANPVVPVERGICSACFYPIPDQELLKLKRRALVQCKGCFRLLFAQEAMDEVANP